jgi:hypothetical protein
MNLDYGDISNCVSIGGKPAHCLDPVNGVPSYEHEKGQFLVYDTLIAKHSFTNGLMLFSHWYGSVCLIAIDGLVPLHHNPDAWWSYRPKIYRWHMDHWWQARGSQEELMYRYTLGNLMLGDLDKALTTVAAEERADELLLSCLTPQQRLEFIANREFRVRGASTKNLYMITANDGFDLLDETDMETLVSYCLHTEHWMPSGDIALATKLMLEDPELEIECLENANASSRRKKRPRTENDRVASERESYYEMLG